MIESCGVIPIFRDHGTLRYLLIQHRHGHHWGFPKGHVDGDETPEVTARRELFEEAGIDQVRLIPGYTTHDQYLVHTPAGKRPKRVTYFVGLVKHPTVRKQQEEISDAHWFDYQTARLVIVSPSARRVLERAHKFLMSHRPLWHPSA